MTLQTMARWIIMAFVVGVFTGSLLTGSQRCDVRLYTRRDIAIDPKIFADVLPAVGLGEFVPEKYNHSDVHGLDKMKGDLPPPISNEAYSYAVRWPDRKSMLHFCKEEFMRAYNDQHSFIYDYKYSEREHNCKGVLLPPQARTYTYEGLAGQTQYLRPVTRLDLPKLANALGLTRHAAEVGVFRGENAAHILTTWKGQMLYLVDAWDSVDIWSSEQGKANYEAMLAAVKPHAGRYTILKNLTHSAAVALPDGHLDYIFIDAGHDYLAVRRDLNAWWPKLRRGGLISGHDYSNGYFPMGGNVVYGVRDAVDEFAALHNHRVYSTVGEPYLSWYMLKCE
jgi:hypothetical protein